MKNYLANITKPIVGLAPMDGITDHPMRYVYSTAFKPDLVFTEFVNVNALAFGQPQVLEKLRYSPKEKPIIAQLSGSDPKHFYLSTLIVCLLGFDGVDINLGCPSRTVVKNGGGAALIGKYKTVTLILKEVKKAVRDYGNGYRLGDLPVKTKNKAKIAELILFSQASRKRQTKPTISVKTRTGINKPIIKDWIGFLLDQEFALITLHGRTAKQQYRGQTDWEEIKQAVLLAKNSQTLIFGNGDITDQKILIEKINASQADGALIGRGALGNPWIFKNLAGLKKSQKPKVYKPGKKEKTDFIFKHARYLNSLSPEKFLTMRKHFGWYCRDFIGAKALRDRLFQTTSLTKLKSVLK